MEVEGFPRAEEALRLLAAATGAARLYPPASALPAEAVARFVERVNAVASAQGPLRYLVDPHGFRIGDAEIAAGQSQVVSLAESLHAMQAGQLVIAPGVSIAETTAFVSLAIADPAALRGAGGLRAALGRSGVAHIAVIEVSLRASEESGLLGIDLLAAPLDEIAAEVAAGAERWARSAQSGPGADEMAAAIDRLEAATRELATERVAAALMRLDEPTRMKVMGFSLMSDNEGCRMDGMLTVIARMKPAALARLLRLVATQAGTDPRRIAGALELPADAAKMLALMLAPAVACEPEFGESGHDHAADLAAEMAQPEDRSDLMRQVAIAAPQLASARALATAVALSRVRTDAETVRAIGDSLPQAARDGAFASVREAMRRLDELAGDATLADAITFARATLADRAVLLDVCTAPATDADAAIAGEILASAGPVGAEALLDTYLRAHEPLRSLLRPVLRGMSESVLGVARTRLRSEDAPRAVAIVRTLPLLGDKRVVPVIGSALEHLELSVRSAAVTALAETPAPEATAALVKAINHWDPQTQRFAVREVGRVHAVSAIPTLARALEDINVFERTHDTKREIIAAIVEIGSPEGLPVLKRTAIRRLWGRKNKELRMLAKRAHEELLRATSTRGEQ